MSGFSQVFETRDMGGRTSSEAAWERHCKRIESERDRLLEALRRHVMDWPPLLEGCPDDCQCSHAAAVRLLAELGVEL